MNKLLQGSALGTALSSLMRRDIGGDGDEDEAERAPTVAEEMALDPEFEALPPEEQTRTVAAFERTVEKILRVPSTGLLEPSTRATRTAKLPPGAAAGASSSPASADGEAEPAAFPAAFDSWLSAVLDVLPPPNSPGLASLEWSHPAGRLAEALAWCDEHRMATLVLPSMPGGRGSGVASDRRLGGYEPLMVSLAKANGGRLRAVATCEASGALRASRERLGAALAAERSSHADLAARRNVAHHQGKGALGSGPGGGGAGGAGGSVVDTRTRELAAAAYGQLVEGFGLALRRNREAFEAAKQARQQILAVAEAVAAASAAPFEEHHDLDEPDPGEFELGLAAEHILDLRLGLKAATDAAPGAAGSASAAAAAAGGAGSVRFVDAAGGGGGGGSAKKAPLMNRLRVQSWNPSRRSRAATAGFSGLSGIADLDGASHSGGGGGGAGDGAGVGGIDELEVLWFGSGPGSGVRDRLGAALEQSDSEWAALEAMVSAGCERCMADVATLQAKIEDLETDLEVRFRRACASAVAPLALLAGRSHISLIPPPTPLYHSSPRCSTRLDALCDPEPSHPPPFFFPRVAVGHRG